ncbi:hypothetical protein PTSG_13104 [Salpingoeca rosetta]|uniref:CCR4-Not complex component Not N-terminal domain-containing protein n=1 Tax=Salpingoeca rosetta (strain ATCC 50818 / BSB-021) TaxID=946362 RepID=F2URH3_SALR5|nr:uncharacterized protein PTSG_13104 [Salpingoeca rosetta]EGD80142.1 hypothetical protein PTSG_13104 [Salpingoeca rosetta]|eukprot:XP_004988204.1 hypothetical protein PTSG_13104 [Salpingoeca rosetta]
MAGARKLQGEIDKCVKAVNELSDQFDFTWEKAENATNSNQKDKFEAELKKLIKKLQKFRDQIKTWLTSSDAKTQEKMLKEYRRKIEVRMERYRDLERDAKTKAYSKEGLDRQARLDPEEQEKKDMQDWINKTMDELRVRIDLLEASLVAKGKRKKASLSDDEVENRKFWIQSHKIHISRLELLLKLLDNDSVPAAQIEPLQDEFETYFDENENSDFYETDWFYEDLEEFLRDNGMPGALEPPEIPLEPEPPKEEDKKKDKKKKKKKEKKSTSTAASEKSTPKTAPSAPAGAVTTSNGNGSNKVAATPTKAKPATATATATAAAGGKGKAVPGTPAKGSKGGPTAAASTPTKPAPASTSSSTTTAAAAAAAAGGKTATTAATTKSSSSSSSSAAPGARGGVVLPPSPSKGPALPRQSSAPAASPAKAAPAINFAAAARRRLMLGRLRPNHLARQQHPAHRQLRDVEDFLTITGGSYRPEMPRQGPIHYPTLPLNLFETTEIYSKLLDTTLFFIFYHRPEQSEAFEIGNYRYFDFAHWVEKELSSFRFEYEHLERSVPPTPAQPQSQQQQQQQQQQQRSRSRNDASQPQSKIRT